jgi:hypothetical protein
MDKTRLIRDYACPAAHDIFMHSWRMCPHKPGKRAYKPEWNDLQQGKSQISGSISDAARSHHPKEE